MTDPQLAHFPETLARLQQQFPAAVTNSQPAAIDPWIEIAPESLVAVCTWLRDTPGLAYEMLTDLTAVDYVQTEKKAQKITFQPHLEVVYHLVSVSLKHRLVLKVILPRWQDDIAEKLPTVPSVAGVWKTADWHEREAFDLFGIQFVGHPDLRRILCPEDWVGYPLRKDYQMPLEYHGIRAK